LFETAKYISINFGTPRKNSRSATTRAQHVLSSYRYKKFTRNVTCSDTKIRHYSSNLTCIFINKMTNLFYFDLWLFIPYVTCKFAVKILLRLNKIPNSATAYMISSYICIFVSLWKLWVLIYGELFLFCGGRIVVMQTLSMSSLFLGSNG